MELIIEYATTERKNETKTTYQMVYKTITVKPIKILRSSCGSNGAAKTRYTYSAVFVAPEGAIDEGKFISANIVRRLNKHFKPGKLNFVGRVANIK